MDEFHRELMDAQREARRAVEEDVKKLAAALATRIKLLATLDAGEAARWRRRIGDLLADAPPPNAADPETAENPESRRARKFAVVASQEDGAPEKIPEIETQILDILEAEPRGMGLTDIHERMLDLGYPLTKGNLSVRLHRMARAFRVETPARGFYSLSPSIREKRGRERA
jgi:hypothetical protein